MELGRLISITQVEGHLGCDNVRQLIQTVCVFLRPFPITMFTQQLDKWAHLTSVIRNKLAGKIQFAQQCHQLCTIGWQSPTQQLFHSLLAKLILLTCQQHSKHIQLFL